MSIEMDFLERSARCPTLEKLTNKVTREKLKLKIKFLDT